MSEWISVKDRLPEPAGSYLVYVKFQWEDEPTEYEVEVIPFDFSWKTVEETDTRTVTEREKKKQWMTSGDITHWQPLPSPPE